MRTRPRLLPALAAVALAGAGLAASPAPARAEAVLLTVQGGALDLQEPGGDVWRPTARVDLALRVVGPLRIGGFVQGAARTGALEDFGIGGGAFVMVRPQIPGTGLFPLAEATGGYLQLPAAGQGTTGLWTTAVGIGAGLHLGKGVSLEVRGRHHWFHGREDAGGLGARAWSVTGGLGFHL